MRPPKPSDVERDLGAWRRRAAAIGAMPNAMPTATIVRARAGIDFEEKSGARRNSGAMRASTSMKPATCCSEKLASSSLGVHPPTMLGMPP